MVDTKGRLSISRPRLTLGGTPALDTRITVHLPDRTEDLVTAAATKPTAVATKATTADLVLATDRGHLAINKEVGSSMVMEDRRHPLSRVDTTKVEELQRAVMTTTGSSTSTSTSTKAVIRVAVAVAVAVAVTTERDVDRRYDGATMGRGWKRVEVVVLGEKMARLS
jgi:hypothetical protein